MTNEEKKEFANVLREVIPFVPQVNDYLINQSVFDYVDSKLEEMQSLRAKLKSKESDLEGERNAFNERERKVIENNSFLRARIAILEKEKQTPCNSCGVTEVITKGYCNCCGAKQ